MVRAVVESLKLQGADTDTPQAKGRAPGVVDYGMNRIVENLYFPLFDGKHFPNDFRLRLRWRFPDKPSR